MFIAASFITAKRWTLINGKQIVVYLYSGILFSHKRNEVLDTRNNMNEAKNITLS